MVETRGLTGAIEAADAMAKAAHVTVRSPVKIEGGLVMVSVRGDIGAVRVATEVGAAAAGRVGELIGAHVIMRPYGGLERFLP